VDHAFDCIAAVVDYEAVMVLARDEGGNLWVEGIAHYRLKTVADHGCNFLNTELEGAIADEEDDAAFGLFLLDC
jgi:hypothetical protein